jgi:hypothetical protein
MTTPLIQASVDSVCRQVDTAIRLLETLTPAEQLKQMPLDLVDIADKIATLLLRVQIEELPEDVRISHTSRLSQADASVETMNTNWGMSLKITDIQSAVEKAIAKAASPEKEAELRSLTGRVEVLVVEAACLNKDTLFHPSIKAISALQTTLNTYSIVSTDTAYEVSLFSDRMRHVAPNFSEQFEFFNEVVNFQSTHQSSLSTEQNTTLNSILEKTEAKILTLIENQGKVESQYALLLILKGAIELDDPVAIQTAANNLLSIDRERLFDAIYLELKELGKFPKERAIPRNLMRLPLKEWFPGLTKEQKLAAVATLTPAESPLSAAHMKTLLEAAKPDPIIATATPTVAAAVDKSFFRYDNPTHPLQPLAKLFEKNTATDEDLELATAILMSLELEDQYYHILYDQLTGEPTTFKDELDYHDLISTAELRARNRDRKAAIKKLMELN